jgi:hypothetical protein
VLWFFSKSNLLFLPHAEYRTLLVRVAICCLSSGFTEYSIYFFTR